MLKKEEEKERGKKKTNKNKQSHLNYKENTGTKLITNTKKHKLKLQQSLEFQEYNVKEKMMRKREKKSH